jgi:hypothetical protein
MKAKMFLLSFGVFDLIRMQLMSSIRLERTEALIASATFRPQPRMIPQHFEAAKVLLVCQTPSCNLSCESFAVQRHTCFWLDVHVQGCDQVL